MDIVGGGAIGYADPSGLRALGGKGGPYGVSVSGGTSPHTKPGIDAYMQWGTWAGGFETMGAGLVQALANTGTGIGQQVVGTGMAPYVPSWDGGQYADDPGYDICVGGWSAAIMLGPLKGAGGKGAGTGRAIIAEAGSSSSWRGTAASLEEQLVMQDAVAGGGRKLKITIGDSLWQGWEKWSTSHKLPNGDPITVHYWKDPFTGSIAGPKFKTPPRGSR